MLRRLALIVTFALFAVVPSTAASACPEGYYDTWPGICLPKAGGTIGNAAERAKNELRGQLVGHPLALWLQQSRDSAIGTSQPIPDHIRRQLTGYIRDDVLRSARYKVGDNGIINAAHAIHGFDRGVSAVTLIDVIVFRDGRDAANNLPLWAHELFHVQQFKDWGVRDFSISYARNPDAVEGPAYDVQNRYWNWANANLPRGPGPGAIPATPGGPFQGAIPAPRPAMICATPYGSCPMGVSLPVGSTCYCPSYAGPVWGVAQ